VVTSLQAGVQLCPFWTEVTRAQPHGTCGESSSSIHDTLDAIAPLLFFSTKVLSRQENLDEWKKASVRDSDGLDAGAGKGA
jgi:hypothetical protein